jgi:predicted permease
MWWRRRTQGDFDGEIQAHLQIEIDRLMEGGATAKEAREAALRAFGNVTKAQERFYESRRWLWADHLIRDLRYAARALRKSPGLTLIAITTMALGIGASAAIFSVVNAVLLRPLPYPQPSRLLMCVQWHTQYGPEVVTLADYLDWRAQATRFDALAGAWNQNFNLTEVEEPERLAGASVTANLFRTLGMLPQIGRAPANDEERSVAVLGHDLWRRQFGGRRDVIGKSIRLNGKPHTVIGVMPAGFEFPAPAELWVPLVPEPGMNRGYHHLWVVGRLKPDVTIEQARAELATIAARAEREHPATNKNWGVAVSTLQDHLAGSSKRPLLILAGAVGCLLLLACANVAGLLMSRSVTRRQEMSVRAALGASRWQIVRQLLTESVLLAGCGGVIGLILATWSISPLLALTTLPRSGEVSVDTTVLIFALVASSGTGILFGLAPAFVAVRSGWHDELTVRGGTGTVRLRPVLVAFQIAVAAVLLAGAGLLMRSFHRLQQVDTGFRAERVLTTRFFLPRATYPVELCVQVYQQMVERMNALAEVESAAAISAFPFSGTGANVVFDIPGRAVVTGEPLTADFRAATRGYFRTMGIPTLDGRDFGSDSAQSQFVAVVNRAFVDRFFAGQNAMGQFVRILAPKPRMIVGVVANIRHRGLDAPVEPQIYVPHTQFPAGSMYLAVRTRLDDPMGIAGAVRAELKKLDPGLPMARFQTATQFLDQTLSRRRFSLTLLGMFAAAALVLSVIGTYGMLSFNVSQRTKEIGIRMALGAGPWQVVRNTVGEAVTPVVTGLGIGLAGALATTHLLGSLLFEIRPSDPATLASGCVMIAGAALVASLVPAGRAARVDPMAALRRE